MFELPPLIVVTGTLSARGGESVKVESHEGDARRATIVRERKVSSARLAANVIVADYTRRLRKLRLTDSPFGALFAASALAEIREILDEATLSVSAFNKEHSGADCAIVCGYVWEPLAGNRLAAVQGWAAFNKEVRAKLKGAVRAEEATSA